MHLPIFPHWQPRGDWRGSAMRPVRPEHKRFVSELALRGPVRLPARPEPRKLDADTRAPAGADGAQVRVPRVRRAAPSAVPQPGGSRH